MSNKLKKFISSALCAAVLISLVPLSASADEKAAPEPAYFDLPVTVDIIKVGLRSGSSRVYEARLLNEASDGYLFGYFDYARAFHELGSTSVGAISMRGDYGFTLPDGMVVGPYHMILNKEFSDFDSAKAYAKKLWGGFPAYINGEYRVLVGAYADEDKTNSEISRRKMNAVPFTGSENAILVAETDTSELQFLLDMGSVTKLGVCPKGDTMDSPTWFHGDAYHGTFEFISSSGAVTVINNVPLEEYVRCVLPYEMHADWPAEALKAQAACARSYAINNMNAYIDRGFDVRNDTYSQVYSGITGTASETDEASTATSGKLVRYKGAVTKVYYMSSDGGATDSSLNVFGQNRPYLIGVKDDNESSIDYYNKDWKIELSDEYILYSLAASGYNLEDIKSISTEKSELGIVSKMIFTDSVGNTVTLYGDDCFGEIGLNSLNFVFSEEIDDDNTRTWVFKGHGWGHNCGLSQWGAYSMALNKNASCDDIIKFYFSGAYLA